jgi:hypothetical protein
VAAGVLFSMGLLWHYSNGTAIDRILSEGVIKLATAGIALPEKGVAWFSSNPHWDPSANRGNLTLKKKEFQPGLVQVNTKDVDIGKFDPEWMDRNMGRFRIGVVSEAAPHDWATIQKLAKIPRAVARSMERADKAEWGDPAQWWGSLVPVAQTLWRTVQRMESGVWVTHVDLGFAVSGESPEGGRWGRS